MKGRRARTRAQVTWPGRHLGPLDGPWCLLGFGAGLVFSPSSPRNCRTKQFFFWKCHFYFLRQSPGLDQTLVQKNSESCTKQRNSTRSDNAVMSPLVSQNGHLNGAPVLDIQSRQRHSYNQSPYVFKRRHLQKYEGNFSGQSPG